MTTSLNATILALHEGCRAQSLDTFQDWALDQVDAVIAFDMGFWASGALLEGRPFVMHAHGRDAPDGAAELLNRTSHLDPVGVKAFMNQGTTFRRDGWDPDDTPEAFRRQFVDPIGARSALVTFVSDLQSGAFTALSIMRRPSTPMFDEQARLDMEQLMPHLQHALTMNRIERASDILDKGLTASYGTIVASIGGVVIAAEQEAAARVRIDWPDWPGGLLPRPLVELISEARASGQPGSLLTDRSLIRVHPSPSQMLLRLRSRNAVDSLGERERIVAEQFATGASYKQIAQELGVSPSTVSNQLGHVYAKLGVTNKLELARLLQQLR